jgi:predicted outer membrane protein
MKKICTTALLAAGFILTSSRIYAGGPAAAGATVSSRDTDFVQTICDDSLMVQRIGELANQRSQNPRVRHVCQKLATDYGKVRQQFSDTAKTMGVPIMPELSAHASRTIERLRSISASSFDKAALRDLVRSEQAVLRKIQDESATGDNPPLKQLAATVLPGLQDDIYQIVTLESDLNASASPATGTAGRGLVSEP